VVGGLAILSAMYLTGLAPQRKAPAREPAG
jgi:hypothetical protein